MVWYKSPQPLRPVERRLRMQTPAHHAAQALLATQVETWLQTMVGKHEALYQQLREAEQTPERERVFQ
jgi:hypothetical protein